MDARGGVVSQAGDRRAGRGSEFAFSLILPLIWAGTGVALCGHSRKPPASRLPDLTLSIEPFGGTRGAVARPRRREREPKAILGLKFELSFGQ
jgi:hypothetical protein